MSRSALNHRPINISTDFPATNNVSASSIANPENEQILSGSRLDKAEDILFIVRYVSVCFSLPLTLCNIFVFLQKDMRSATAVYVIGLSSAQLVYVITTSLQHISLLTFRDPMNDGAFWTLSLYGSIYCGIVARRGVYLVMSLVSLERLYAIARPLHVKGFILSRRPVISMTSAYLITAVLHVYILAKTEVKSYVKVGIKMYKPAPTPLYLQHKDINDAFSMLAKVMLTYVALLTQISLNIMTVWFLQRHNKALEKLKVSAKEVESRQRERQLTVTILAATFSYVVLSLPSALHHLVYTIFPAYNGLFGKYRNLYALIQSITFILSVLSCGVDFVCFMLLSSKYRKTFIRIMGIRPKGASDFGILCR